MKKIILCLTLLAGTLACAELVTYNFSGEVSYIDTSLADVTDTTYSIGQTITAVISYDLATGSVVFNTSSSSDYTGSLQSLWVNNGAETIGGSAVDGNAVYTTVFNDSAGTDAIQFRITSDENPPVGTGVEALPLDNIWLTFTSLNTDQYADTSLPESVDPADFTFERLQITYYARGVGNYIVNVDAVPEPATAMMLFFGGGIGFVVNRLRRWANR